MVSRLEPFKCAGQGIRFDQGKNESACVYWNRDKNHLVIHQSKSKPEEEKGVSKMMRNFLQDWLINKMNGYFILLYATDHFRMAWIVGHMNDLVVFVLVLSRLIPPRRRVAA